ncbi:unnamed protein product [Arctia plantaginis]|uniref:Uncharacterized protein n=1 Tax=Arctia plantaginis TaxID=874455 RepID=A0A8S0ZNW8_ARCPL|nr:unnamed protein product [Arctia plantaginis]
MPKTKRTPPATPNEQSTIKVTENSKQGSDLVKPINDSVLQRCETTVDPHKLTSTITERKKRKLTEHDNNMPSLLQEMFDQFSKEQERRKSDRLFK